jgi:hypothetical protein
MTEHGDVTGTVTGQTERERALHALAGLNVTTVTAHRDIQWATSELQLLVQGLAMVPPGDQAGLWGMTVVRDRQLPWVTAAVPGWGVAGNSHRPNVAASLCSRHDLSTSIHMHLSDVAFNVDYAQLWGADRLSQTVVHEAGHIRTIVREVEADTALRQAKSDLDAQIVAANDRMNQLTIRRTDPPLANLARAVQDPCWRACSDATTAATQAANAAIRMSYSVPDPRPDDWRAGLAGLAQLIRTVNVNAAAARDAIQQTVDTVTQELRARDDRTEIIRNCLLALHAINAVLDLVAPYLRLIVGLGAAKRQIEYFVWRMAHLTHNGQPADPFRPFTDYGATAHVEWFAETYALAAMNPAELARRSRPAADWFAGGLPGLPTGVMPFG